MKRFVLFMTVALLSTGCRGQQQPKEEPKDQETAENLANQPQVRWDVKKETDEHGNIIRYDSTYTWSYANVEGDSMVVDVDSVMQSFHSYFNTQLPYLWDRSFTQPLWQDSLFYKDFYQQDYFYRRWQQDFFHMDEMFRRMDSIRNQFFYDRYPGMLMPPPADKKKKG